MSRSNTVAAISEPTGDVSEHESVAALHASPQKKCPFCGNNSHNRRFCPARSVTCHSCGKNGHFAKVCKSKSSDSHATAAIFPKPSLCALPGNYPSSLGHAVVPVRIHGVTFSALVDSASSDNFIIVFLSCSLLV